MQRKRDNSGRDLCANDGGLEQGIEAKAGGCRRRIEKEDVVFDG